MWNTLTCHSLLPPGRPRDTNKNKRLCAPTRSQAHAKGYTWPPGNGPQVTQGINSHSACISCHHLLSGGIGPASSLYRPPPAPFFFPCLAIVYPVTLLRQPLSHEHHHLSHSSNLSSSFLLYLGSLVNLSLQKISFKNFYHKIWPPCLHASSFLSKISIIRFGPPVFTPPLFAPRRSWNCQHANNGGGGISWHPGAGLALIARPRWT